MIKIFLLSFILLLYTPLWGENLKKDENLNFTISSKILNNDIFIGDIINYEIIVDKKDKKDSFFIKKPSFSPFELIDISEKNSDTNSIFNVKLTIYKVGNFEIPKIDILAYYQDKNSNITIPKKEIIIKSLLSDGENIDIADIKNNIPIKEKTYIFLWIIGGIITLLIAFAIFKILQYKRKIIKESIELPPRAANEIAYEKLSLLISKKLIQKGEYKKYYFELSEIIREYLGNRYQFDSIELTSDELLTKLKQTLELSRAFIPTIENFLEDTDLVKFSKVTPEQLEIESVTQGGFKIVEELK